MIRNGAAQQLEVTRREDGHVFLLRIAYGSHRRSSRRTPPDRTSEYATARSAASEAGLYEHGVPPGADSYYNDRWAAILGYATAELPETGRFLDWLFERIHPADRAALEQAYDTFGRDRADRYDVQVRLRHKDGHWLWVRGVAQPIERDEHGRATRIAGLMFDVSGERAASDELRWTA